MSKVKKILVKIDVLRETTPPFQEGVLFLSIQLDGCHSLGPWWPPWNPQSLLVLLMSL